jgi:NAD(P)-dependent dehydrogenase (short-subunit alcohol dehydrogenase family)
MAGLLKDRVAIVTGTGRGLGRAEAIAMATQGAKLVVNDLGTATDGSGVSRALAEEVAAEIKKAGGTAVPNCASVASAEGAESIIKTALDSFGRIDILVNNAGFNRDRMIYNLSDEEWESVIKTNLSGTFYCTRAACKVMCQQNYGRIIPPHTLALATWGRRITALPRRA